MGNLHTRASRREGWMDYTRCILVTNPLDATTSTTAGGKVMQPFGKFYSVDGCTCSLCRSRGYRKGNGYDAELRTCKHRARQQSKQLIDKELRQFEGIRDY